MRTIAARDEPQHSHVLIGIGRSDSDAYYRNPASPDVLKSSWEYPRTITPTSPASTVNNVAQSSSPHVISSPLSPVHSVRSPSAPTSPVRARSTNDLLAERERAKNLERQSEFERPGGQNIVDFNLAEGMVEMHEHPKESKEQEP